jgi:hypothetical protein
MVPILGRTPPTSSTEGRPNSRALSRQLRTDLWSSYPTITNPMTNGASGANSCVTGLVLMQGTRCLWDVATLNIQFGDKGAHNRGEVEYTDMTASRSEG